MLNENGKKLLINVGAKLAEIWSDPSLTDKEKIQVENFLKAEAAKGFEIIDEPLPKFLEKYRITQKELNQLKGDFNV